MATTYEPIATTTLGSAAATVTFSSIASTYTDLFIVSSLGVTAAADIYLNFNGDTTSGLYSFTQLGGDGSAASSQRASNQNRVQLDFPGYAQNVLGATNFTISVQNYSNSTTYKTSLTRFNNMGGAAGLGTNATVGLWRNTNAITSITLTASGTTFLTGSTFTLYGIKAA